MSDKLAIFEKPVFDDSIIENEYHTYSPYGSQTYSFSDEVRVSVQSQDVYTCPADSYIYIEGKITLPENVVVETEKKSLLESMTNNAYGFLFEEIRYELNGVEIDRCKNVGITSLIKNFLCLTPSEASGMQVSGFTYPGVRITTVADDGTFSGCISLKSILGFAEDYDCIVVNARQELIMILARSDKNSYKADKDLGLSLTKIQWKLPHINVNLENKVNLVNTLQNDIPISIGYRKWELYELPALKDSTMDSWTVKTSTNLEKPRFVILAFQTDKKNSIRHDISEFSHANLRNIKLSLNSKTYPYDDLDLNFGKRKFSKAYMLYKMFQMSFYNRKKSEPLIPFEKFETHPLFVIDVSNQSDSDKTSSVDVQLMFEANSNFPKNTCVYCLIISDAMIQYYPLNGIVNRVV